MSTYLSCFIVSDFGSISETVNTNGIGDNFEMRVFATPAQIDKAKFALETGVAITEYYIDYFQIAYPLPKLGKYPNHEIDINVNKSYLVSD